MKLIHLSIRVMRGVLLLACGAACAADSPPKARAAESTVLPPVTVSAVGDPVDKSYRRILQGTAVFEEKHGLAPNASLRFRLLPRQRSTNMNGIELEIVGDTVAIPVPVAADHTFALARHPKALEENASVMPNRKAGSLTWRADIRTPGLPPDTRRLGDLRLECHIGMHAGLVSHLGSVIERLAQFIRSKTDYCDRSRVNYLFFADRPLFSVVMADGNRRETLSVDDLYGGDSGDPLSPIDLAHCDCEVLRAQSYFLPLGDRSWPDDTLIEFEYMDEANDRQGVATPASAAMKRDVQ